MQHSPQSQRLTCPTTGPQGHGAGSRGKPQNHKTLLLLVLQQAGSGSECTVQDWMDG